MILKVVGFAEAIVKYYKIEDLWPTCGLPISVSRPKAVSGIPAEHIRLPASIWRWCITATLPIIIP